MKDLYRNILYQGKNMFRDLDFTFWGLMYPIILATFFFVTFSGITNLELEPINVGLGQDNPYLFILEDIDILNVILVEEKDIATSLDSEKIDGFIQSDLNTVVDRSGLGQTIIKGIADQILQTMALGESIENIDFNVDYLSGQNQEAKGILVIFYSLIAMVSTYGVFAGIEAVNLSQANLSPLGARINITPIRKSTLLFSGMVVGVATNIASNILLIVYLQYVLKLELLTNLGYSAVFILLGNIFGISLGLLIGSSNKKSPGVKTMFSIVLTLFLSFLAGLMSPDIKVAIDKSFPIVSKLNPVSIVTNSLYRINLLGNTSNLTQGMVALGVYSILLLGISYLFLRRSQYDSI